MSATDDLNQVIPKYENLLRKGEERVSNATKFNSDYFRQLAINKI